MYRGNTPEDHAAASEHVERKKGPPVGYSWKREWPTSESSAELARQIAEELDRPPATDDAEKLHMCRAIHARNHHHDIEALQREKLRVLKCRQ
jgi:hypothetical protein